MFVPKNKEQLFRIHSVKPFDFTYPYCHICHKCVTVISNQKKWRCNSCREEYSKVKYCYKMSLELSNGQSLKQATLFGSQVNVIFGVSADVFFKFIQKLKSDFEGIDVNKAIQHAFKNCLIGRWCAFEFKQGSNRNLSNQEETSIVRSFRMPMDMPIGGYCPIHSFLEHTHCIKKRDLNFSDSLESVIDLTLSDKSGDGEELSFVCDEINKLHIRNGLMESPSKSQENLDKLNEVASTPISKRLTRRHSRN